MSDRSHRISRRTLLQVGGLAPFAALAARGASSAQVMNTCKNVAPISEEPTMKDLVLRAKAHVEPKKKLDESKFRLVAQMLWCYFVIGADPTTILDPGTLALAAYDKTNSKGEKCGDLVAERLYEWDEQGHHPATDVCAFSCGRNASKIAANQEVATIDVPQFKQAFNQTESDMKTKMVRLRAIQAEKVDAGIRGLGC